MVLKRPLNTARMLIVALALATLSGVATPSSAANRGTGNLASFANSDRLATPYSQGFETRHGALFPSEFHDQDMVIASTDPGYGVSTTSYAVWDGAHRGYASVKYTGIGTRSFYLDKYQGDYPFDGDYKASLQFVDFTDVALRITDGTHSTVSLDVLNPASVTSPIEAYLTDVNGNSIYLCQVMNSGWNHASFNFSTNNSWSSSTYYTKFGITVDNDSHCSSHSTQSQHFGAWSFDNVALNGYEVLSVTGTAHATGTAKVKKILTAGTIAASGTDPIISYQWYSCKKATQATESAAFAKSPDSLEAFRLTKASCTAISSATQNTFTLVKAQKGKYVRVMVTVQNSGATMHYLSTGTAKVK